MKKSKLVQANEKIADAVVGGYKKIEDGVVGGYKKIEDGVVGGYKKIENGVVGAYQKVEDGFVDRFLTNEGETAEDAKKRLTQEQEQPESQAQEGHEKAGRHPRP